jgi:hypothetical protein
MSPNAATRRLLDGPVIYTKFHRFEWTHPRYGSLAFKWEQAKVRGRYPRGRQAAPTSDGSEP